MDLPVFHLDFLNNRMLIAIIAILHVVINHGMAVGGIPLIAFLERRGVKTGDGRQLLLPADDNYFCRLSPA